VGTIKKITSIRALLFFFIFLSPRNCEQFWASIKDNGIGDGVARQSAGGDVKLKAWSQVNRDVAKAQIKRKKF